MTTRRYKDQFQRQNILPGFESGHYEPRRHYDRAEIARSVADHLRRDNRVSIRVSGRDLEEIKRLALAEGVPPQSLLARIIHLYACGELQEPGPQDDSSKAAESSRSRDPAEYTKHQSGS